MSVEVVVNNKSFTLDLDDNKTAQSFLELLPIELATDDVNCNEKFCLIANPITSQPKKFCQLESGALLLFQTHALTFIYEDCESCYRFSKIGQIRNLEGFKESMSGKHVLISFEETVENN